MRKYPSSVVTLVRFPASARDVEVTVAPATTAPDGSFTTPAIDPTGTCAQAAAHAARPQKTRTLNIEAPLKLRLVSRFVFEGTAKAREKQATTGLDHWHSGAPSVAVGSASTRANTAPRFQNRPCFGSSFGC